MVPDALPQVPFYLDWKFWSFATSLLAIFLSQVPPLRILLRRAKLEIEAFSAINVSHKIGNPNALLHIILSNSGGRQLIVRRIELQITPNGEAPISLIGENYFQLSDDKASVLLTRFRLAPGEDWSHGVVFFSPFSQQEEKHCRILQSNLQKDIHTKLAQLPQESLATTPRVVADDVNVKPILEFFDKKFRWQPGEYNLTIKVITEPRNIIAEKNLRMTIFESDSNELKEFRNEFKFGNGIYFGFNPGVRIPLNEA